MIVKKKKKKERKETARHLSTEEAIIFQLFFGMVKKGIRMCLKETELFLKPLFYKTSQPK